MTVTSAERTSRTGAARRRSVLDVSVPFVNMLVYGDPGVGKTVFASTGPGPVLFLDVDYGTMSLSRMRPELVQELGVNLKEVEHEQVRGVEDISRLMRELRNEFTADPKRYGTICLDNLTELQRVLMLEYLRAQNEKGLPKQQDWHYILVQMQWVVRQIRSLPCHTVFTAHLQDKEGVKAPALSGRIAEEIPGYFDIMAYYMLQEKEVPVEGEKEKTKIQVQRALYCQPHPRIRAKDRSGRLSTIEYPHFTRIIEKICSDDDSKE